MISPKDPRIPHPPLVLMGVSGSGKTTLGQLLSERLGARFFDADDFHPPENVEKMRSGVALTDEDRVAWLSALSVLLREASARRQPTVLACSALRRGFRDALRKSAPSLRFLFLSGPRSLLAERLEGRVGHYMPGTLLETQLEALEPPTADESDVLTLEIGSPVNEIARQALAMLDQFER
ncbi:MAG: gluconokinase [Verrucomicrobiales bacterium]